ncbi:cobaltochelatase subunit CobN [Rhizobium sp. FKL33]|uniref:cobaltochelatase subunit CobN n=1 Tax=Rhizobium sp. FKL33 TaxID=2562307 RepID=UPI0010C08FE0|nr:cobaltochelatase subunit CobN [Rhizobium sp. FKL33]
MHLLLAQKGSLSDSEDAVDLGQTPGEIVFLSAADTEIASVARATAESAIDWRIVNLASLKHPMSIDLWIEKTARHSKLVVLRALGGYGYFTYLIEALMGAAQRHGFQFATLPGDDRPDAGVDAWSTVAAEDVKTLWTYLVEAGAENVAGFSRYCEALSGRGEKPAAPVKLDKAGIWWPGRGVVDVDVWEEVSVGGSPPSALPGISPSRGEIEGGEASLSLEPSRSGRRSRAQPISPLEGEMSGRTEGGIPQALRHPEESAPSAQTPLAVITFYKALVQSGQTAPVEALIEALQARGLRVLPIFVTSLKEPVSAKTIRALFQTYAPDVVLNATSFAVVSPGAEKTGTVLDETGAQVLQVIFSALTREAWESSTMGLATRDLAMNVALPEVDGRVLTRAVSFKKAARFDPRAQVNIVGPEPEPSRIAFVAEQAARWARLRRLENSQKNVALILANYPNRDGRLGNGVGLDTPAGALESLKAMKAAGYVTEDLPESGDGLINHLMAGPTNAAADGREIRETLSLSHYKDFFARLPVQIQDEVTARWGGPEDDPFFLDGAFALPLCRFGQVLTGIQPARGYNIDPKETYHSPDLVPPHGYFAFYAFIREAFGADVAIHMGKHGNMEWLPGKSLALSETCYPEAVFGPLPHLYPFIVNDPGEGTQAKRRSSAVILDHLTPPLTRAESYGYLKDLEALVDEYFLAQGSDPRRIVLLKKQILDLAADTGLGEDVGIAGLDEDAALQKLDAWLCDLKELQIRDGLHVFGVAPQGRLLTDLTVALVRVPRGDGEGGNASLQRAMALDLMEEALLTERVAHPPLSCRTSPPQGGRLEDARSSRPTSLGDETLELAAQAGGGPQPISPLEGEMSGRAEGGNPGSTFDPLDCDMAAPWTGPRAPILTTLIDAPWRTNGDAVERIELLASKLVSGEIPCPDTWLRTRTVLDQVETRLKPSIEACGHAEIEALMRGLSGRFVSPGPSGAPTRGRPDVLPTGKNFYSVDTRAVPTPTAWELGRKSAELLVTRYAQDHGDWPKSLGITAWGTSNMRTGGDDIAQALALIGAKPVWDMGSARVTGYEIIPVSMLGRPRVDVTLRISGFFRDAFPEQIALFDKAVRAIGGLDEDEADNPIAARMKAEAQAIAAKGEADDKKAARQAGYRVFGSKPGAYGAGLQALMDEGGWENKADLAESFVEWGGYAYGAEEEGEAERGLFETRLSQIEAVVQNQDNREHDLLDSDDYYQFQGGMAAAAEHLSGQKPAIYHNDHSRPEKPVIRSLEEEISRVVRGRVVNPKWIAGAMRHGYKGASEMAATVDFMFAYAATTGAVKSHHFEAAYQAYLMDETVRDFLSEKNEAALREMAQKLIEAMDRKLWSPKSNSARFELEELAGIMINADL